MGDSNTTSRKDKIYGIIQLAIVVAFIVISYVASQMLNISPETESTALAQKSQIEKRVLFAKVAEISPTQYQIEFDATGTIQARATVSVVPQVSGRIAAINSAFFAGGHFKAGETLFEIEPRDYALEVQRQEALVAQARTNFNLEEAESAAAIAEWQQVNQKKNPPYLVARKPQKEEAWANLRSAKAQLAQAELNLERTKFILPFAGRVLSSTLAQGQYVSAGQSYGAVYDLAALETTLSLQGNKLDWLLGTESPDVTVEVDYLGRQRQYPAILKRGISALDMQTRFATVYLGFQEPPVDLVPGIFANIHVRGPRLDHVYLAPISALQKSGTVWAVDAEDKLYPLQAETIFADEMHLVLQGTQESVRIVTSKIPGAIEGMKINILDGEEGSRAPSR